MKKLLSHILDCIFPTRISRFGQHIFYITWEDSYIERLQRIDQMYRFEIDRDRATFGTLF